MPVCGREDHENQFQLQQQATTMQHIYKREKQLKKIVFNSMSCNTDLKIS